MPVSLPKGANVSLSKQAPGLKNIVIGLGWDARATAGRSDFDLDASVFLLKDDGKVRSDADFVFYNNRTSPEGAVEHLGDNLTGAGDEQRIRVDLDRVPSEVAKLSVVVSIHEAEGRRQNFEMVSNAFIRVVNGADNSEIARYDLSEETSTETAMILGEVYRRGGEWKFRAVGQGYAGGLGPLARDYGVNVPYGESDPPPSESPNPPDPARREISMRDLHHATTEALDMLGLEYVQNEDRNDVYLIGRDGVLLMVGVKGMDGVPVGIVIVAIVLRNVECTKELAVDLLKRNGRATFATWEISDGSDGTVDVSFSYQLSAEQLDVELVARMVNWVLEKSTEEIDALQAKYGGQRAFVVKEEQPPVTIMPTGPLTYAGRFPGYKPAQAMAAFLSVPGEGRPSYQEIRDYIWVFKGGGEVLFDGEGYEVVVGCCAEPDGTPVVVVTGFCEKKPEYAEKVGMLILREKSALEQSAHSTEFFGEEGIAEAASSGALRQLRPSEIGPIPESVRQEPAPAEAPDPPPGSSNIFRRFREGRERRREEQEKRRLENERAKWLTAPIQRDHSAVDPPPSLEELADRAIQHAGPNIEFDHDAVVAYVYNFCFTRATGIMKRDSLLFNAVHGLWVIRERDDFERRMLWDYLTMQGPRGKALHEILAEETQSDNFIEVVADRIRRGALCDVDEAYRLSGDDVDTIYFSDK